MHVFVDPRVVKILETVKASPSVTIPDLASHLGLSNSRLGHVFKNGTGVALAVFLEQRRMERASELLRSTETRIKEITYLVGYLHESSFSRAFQKWFHCTPTDYRKKQRSLLQNGVMMRK